jgi:hypothetical protein
VAGELADEAHATPVTPEQAGAAARGAAERIEAGKAAAYGKVAGKLQQAVQRGGAVAPEQAGAGVRQALREVAGYHHDAADEAYRRIRGAEEHPANVEHLQTAPRGSEAERQILSKLASNAAVDQVDPATGDPLSYKRGAPPTVRELTAMRQIEAELDAMPYEQGGMIDTGVQDGYDLDERVYKRGHAGAPVYHDILERMGVGMSDTTRGQVLADIRHTLETGEWNRASRAAWDVAKARVRGDGSLVGPALPEGQPLLGTTTPVAMPVAVGPAKRLLQPIYERLMRERAVTGTLMGDRGRALVALDQLMQAPEYAPLSVVDQVLGDLKTFARAEIPELRTQGQGVMAQAVRALEQQVRATATKYGVLDALEEGRAATIEKYKTGDALLGMRDGDVHAFRQVVAPGDTNIAQLRAIQQRAPSEVGNIARALVDTLIADATVDGAYSLERAKAIEAKWNAIGPETKRILFSPGTLRRLDAFFANARKAGAEPFLASGASDVGTFTRLVGPRDTGIANLRALQQVSPDSIPKLARAWLDALFDRAKADGGFDRAAGLRAEWDKLGPGTKRILFPKAGQAAALDHFFRLADKLQQPLNTSKSAIVGIVGTSGWALLHPVTGVPMALSGAAIAKLLQSPAGIRALTRGLQLSQPGARVSPALRVQVYGQLLRAAREAAAPVPAGTGSTNPTGQQNR